MQGHQGGLVVGVAGWLVAQEDDAERGVVRAKRVDRRQRRGDPGLVAGAEIGIGLVVAVGVGPAVEAARCDAVELAGRKVVAEQVAAVVGGEELAGRRLPVEAHRIAQPRGEDLLAAAVQLHAQHGGPPGVLLLAHVAARADRDVEAVVRPHAQRARPVIALLGQPRDDALVGAAGLALVGIEADTADRIHLRHVEPALVEIEAVRAREPLQEGAVGVRAAVAVGVALQQVDAARPGHAHQQIARLRQTQEARVREAGMEPADREAPGHAEALGHDLRGRRIDAALEEQVGDRRVDGESLGEEPVAGGDRRPSQHDGDQKESAHAPSRERAEYSGPTVRSASATAIFPRGGP